jgi:hypothetical protein
MIVRISGEDQYRVPEEDVGQLNELDRAVIDLVDSGREDGFADAYRKLLDYVRTHGTRVGDEEIESSDLILPPPDLSFEEAGKEFTGEGLIPD